jgi:pantetheine-phosphate adenylyltransferase
MTAALCPGSFDPPTNGHIDVVSRAARMFDRVVVAVVENPSKEPLFALEERLELLGVVFRHLDGVEIASFSGLLVDFVRDSDIDVIVKGLRAGGDFDYELQMAQMNQHLSGVETVFLPTSPRWSYVSSTLVREVARLGGSVEALLPAEVAHAVKEKLS